MLSKEEFIALASVKYEEVKALEDIKDFYNYEKTFDEIWTSYGRETLERSISKAPKDRRKKKLVSLRKDRNSKEP